MRGGGGGGGGGVHGTAPEPGVPGDEISASVFPFTYRDSSSVVFAREAANVDFLQAVDVFSIPCGFADGHLLVVHEKSAVFFFANQPQLKDKRFSCIVIMNLLLYEVTKKHIVQNPMPSPRLMKFFTSVSDPAACTSLNKKDQGPFILFSPLQCRRFGRESVSYSGTNWLESFYLTHD